MYFKEVPIIDFNHHLKLKDPKPSEDGGAYASPTPPIDDAELFEGADNLRFRYVKNYCWESKVLKQIKYDASTKPGDDDFVSTLLTAIFVTPLAFTNFIPGQWKIVDEVWVQRICNFSVYDRITDEFVESVDAVVDEFRDDDETHKLWHEQQASSIGAEDHPQYHPKGEDDFDDLAEEYFNKKRSESGLGSIEPDEKIGGKTVEGEDQYYEFSLYAADPNILDKVDELYLIERVNIEGKTGYFSKFTNTKLSLGQPISAELLKKVVVNANLRARIRNDCIYIPEIITPEGQPRRYSGNFKMGIISNTQYKVYFKTQKSLKPR